MPIMNRMKRLIKADAHAFIEGLEDPKWVLAQAVRDMEEELEKAETDLEARRSHVRQLQSRILSNEEVLASLEKDISFAMKEKKEEIAKSLIKKLLIVRKNLEAFQEKFKVSQEDLIKREIDVKEKQESYRRIHEQCELLNLQRTDDDAFQCASRLVASSEAVDFSLEHQVEIEFLRRLRTEGSHEN